MAIQDIITQAANRYGVDPGFLLQEARIESGLNPNASNPTSSAKGLFQFIDSTRARYGNFDPFDPAASADAGARLARDNFEALRRGLGRDPSPAELYLAHQQGAAGALKLLANPSIPAESVVGADAVRLNGGQPGMTAGEFAQLWTRKFGGAGGSAVGAPLPAEDVAQRGPALTAALPPAPLPSLEQPKQARPDLAMAKKRSGSLDLGALFRDLSPNLRLAI